jgi:hypothetical protein
VNEGKNEWCGCIGGGARGSKISKGRGQFSPDISRESLSQGPAPRPPAYQQVAAGRSPKKYYFYWDLRRPYSPNVGEDDFCEARMLGVLRSSRVMNAPKFGKGEGKCATPGAPTLLRPGTKYPVRPPPRALTHARVFATVPTSEGDNRARSA